MKEEEIFIIEHRDIVLIAAVIIAFLFIIFNNESHARPVMQQKDGSAKLRTAEIEKYWKMRAIQGIHGKVYRIFRIEGRGSDILFC